MGIKSDPIWKPDKSGLIREVRVSKTLSADMSSDLLLRNALQRRSIAFDHCLLVKYEVFEKWTDVMIDAYLAEPPVGYGRVSIDQLHRADMELFKFIISETKDGIKPARDGTSPVEEAVKKGMDVTAVRLALQPLQGGTAAKRSRPASSDAHEDDSDMDKLRKQLAEAKAQIQAMGKKRRDDDGKQGKGGKGKGKGEGKGMARGKMPKDLRGGVPRTDDDENICFGYNLGTCSLAKPGAKCKKGLHVCCKAGCFEEHSFTKVHKAS